MRGNQKYVVSALIVLLLLMPIALELSSMAQVMQNYNPPTISLPFVFRSALKEYGEVKLQEFSDVYYVTPPFTGVDISISLNVSDMLDYNVANETIPPDVSFIASTKSFLSSLNESTVLSIIVTVNCFNETMMYYSAYRNFLDIALEWAETTSDALMILANDEATPANLMYILKQAQHNSYVSEINMVVLTHGIFTNDTHGMILWNEDGPKIVEPSLLYEYYGGEISKLNFVFLPFCNVEDEYSEYGDYSIKGFFLNLGANEVIGGSGNIILNAEYLSWVQDILLGGIWTDEYGYFEIPVYDNESGNWLTITIEYNSTVGEEELPVIQGNETTLGRHIGSRGRRGNYKTMVKRTSVKVTVKKGISKNIVKRTNVRKIGTRSWRHISGRAKHSMIGGYLLGRGRSQRSRKSGSNSFNAKINSYKDKINRAKGDALSSFVIADKIISKIYGGYITAKNKLRNMIYRNFNWVCKFPASMIWSVIKNSVLKGVNWLISKITRSNRFKSLISVAYNMLKAGKSSWELALVLIGWGVTKFASRILGYFGNFANWILSKFGNVGNWLKKLINGWIDPAMKFASNKLSYFEKKLKSALNSLAQTLGSVLVYLVGVIKDSVNKVINDLIKSIKNSAVSLNDLTALINNVMTRISGIVSTISKVMVVINIAQTTLEVATAGIGAIITRIVLPLIAAVVVDQVLPAVVKKWTNVQIQFKPINAEDVINIIKRGLAGLIKYILPKILSIVLAVSVLKYSSIVFKELGLSYNFKISGDLTSILLTLMTTIVLMGTFKSLENLLGGNLKDFISKVMKFIEYSKGKAGVFRKSPVKFVDEIWEKAVETASNTLKEIGDIAGIAGYILLNLAIFLWLMRIGHMLIKGGVGLTEKAVIELKNCVEVSSALFLTGLMTSLLSDIFLLLSTGEQFVNSAKAIYEAMRAIIDAVIIMSLVVDDVQEVAGKTFEKLNKKALMLEPGEAYHYGKYWAAMLKGMFEATNILIGALLIYSLALRYKRIFTHTSEIKKYKNWIAITMSSIAALTTIESGRLALKCIMESVEKLKEKLGEATKITETVRENEKEQENEWGWYLQLIGDIIAISTFISGSLRKMNEKAYLTGIVIGGFLGIAGDIAYDKKMSYFDIVSAFYIGFDTYLMLKQWRTHNQ